MVDDMPGAAGRHAAMLLIGVRIKSRRPRRTDAKNVSLAPAYAHPQGADYGAARTRTKTGNRATLPPTDYSRRTRMQGLELAFNLFDRKPKGRIVGASPRN